MLVRDYRNPNKPSWTKAVIQRQLGPQSYSCVLSHNNNVIKRHLDQIRGHNLTQQQQPIEQPTTTNNNNTSSSEPVPMQMNEDVSLTRMELRPREGGRVVKK